MLYLTIFLVTISDKQLESIYDPIGLDIGALTPGEIAFRIYAELIQVRRSGELSRLIYDVNLCSFYQNNTSQKDR